MVSHFLRAVWQVFYKDLDINMDCMYHDLYLWCTYGTCVTISIEFHLEHMFRLYVTYNVPKPSSEIMEVMHFKHVKCIWRL